MNSRWLNLIFLTAFLPSCASAPTAQPQVNSLAVARHINEALQILDAPTNRYGSNNQLLYLLDKAYVLQIAGHYQESIETFEKVKKLLDRLYTRSVSRLAATWLTNDYTAPYVGEDFEHILVNVLQAINFAVLGNFQEALVEARDVDLRLRVINDLYRDSGPSIYKEDAFARLLMGILYEATGSKQDYNDAYISYKQSLAAYESEFYKSTQTPIPRVLIENLLAAAKYFDSGEFQKLREKFPDVGFSPIQNKQQMAEIYVIQYNGLSPLKHPSVIPIPLPGPYITKFSFPTYDRRYYETTSSLVTAINSSNKQIQSTTELGENIESIAIQSLKARRARVYAKAIIRPILKYGAEYELGRKIEDKEGEIAGYAFKGLSSLYNLYTEQADLRSWQTLPAQIRIGHLMVDPGTYRLTLTNLNGSQPIGDRPLPEVTLKAGEKKFILVRTVE